MRRSDIDRDSGIEANLGAQPADSFLRNLHPDLKADFILANPPFNISDWSGIISRNQAPALPEDDCVAVLAVPSKQVSPIGASCKDVFALGVDEVFAANRSLQ